MMLEFSPVKETKLSPSQEAFAQWLATPKESKTPKTQREYAKIINVDENTLTNWKRNDELWLVFNECIYERGRESLAQAQQVIEAAINGEVITKIQLDAARDTIDRYGQMKRHASIVASIQDMYNAYHKK